jgi:A/G-specific adenine glycosylase
MKAGALFAALLAWYDGARRELPWRAPPGERTEPYHVLVSEVMLQQTTVATVRPRYAAFLARFPDLATLAAAPLDDVLHAWQGLGYYRRARGLHAAARAALERHGGRLPADVEALEALPGIGPYTAAAVAAIAYDVPVLAVDANVERVLARLFAVATPLPQARGELRRIAGELAPSERPGDAVQALMELGALVCRPREPACLACPLRACCAAHRAGIAQSLPKKTPKAARAARYATAFHLTRADGAVLFRRRPESGLLGGLIELPSTPWREAAPDDPEAEAPATAPWRRVPGTVRHVFTHLTLELELRVGRLEDARAVGVEEPIWCPPGSFDSLALPTLTRKLLAHVDRAGEPRG